LASNTKLLMQIFSKEAVTEELVEIAAEEF
jgi:hypothetical protein